jgi:hypothetical protein
MAGKRSHRSQTDQMSAALDRWEGEGGAQEFRWALRHEGDELGAKDRQILECLGAALVSGWSELPTDVQRAIFRHATAYRTYDSAGLRAKIARFLHHHKGGADIP